jgi:hypothetical protein
MNVLWHTSQGNGRYAWCMSSAQTDFWMIKNTHHRCAITHCRHTARKKDHRTKNLHSGIFTLQTHRDNETWPVVKRWQLCIYTLLTHRKNEEWPVDQELAGVQLDIADTARCLVISVVLLTLRAVGWNLKNLFQYWPYDVFFSNPFGAAVVVLFAQFACWRPMLCCKLCTFGILRSPIGLLVIRCSSTCLGLLYSHHQEVRLRFTAYGFIL